MPDQHGQLLGVYETRQQAEAAARLAREAGVPENAIRIGDERDEVPALEAEMREEMTQSVVSPQAALVLPKRAAKAMSLVLPVAAVIGGLIGVPFAFMHFGNLAIGGRLLITVLIGAAAGVTAGYVFAGAAVRGPAEPLAAERGVTVRIGSVDQAVVDALAASNPIRLDVVEGDTTVDLRTVTTEEDSDDSGVLDDMKATMRQPEGDWHQNQQLPKDGPTQRRG